MTKTAYKTNRGSLLLGDSAKFLDGKRAQRLEGRVQMVFTSPPFPLNRKKKYGNLSGSDYIEWLVSFAKQLCNLLTKDGSIVIEIGNGWDEGQPTVSTLAVEALLEFKRRGNLHLCQEFICFNPARLPSPAQWVTVERCRVKDAFTRVWWMSLTPWPKADNAQVLTSYSPAMKKLLERGTYNPGKRPSEHHIGQKSFLSDNGGAIPPNVLVPALDDILSEICQASDVLPIANTSTTDKYQNYCRTHLVGQHPARMPTRLVEFFTDFLTSQNDLILDPFGGSNTTGLVAEQRCRKWISIEADPNYAVASSVRFEEFKGFKRLIPLPISPRSGERSVLSKPRRTQVAVGVH